MTLPASLRFLFAAALAATTLLPTAVAQPIKLGELNSYKTFPAFLEPYKKGMELALDEINAAGGVLGRPLAIVSRDDNGSPGDAVRVAEELIAREKVVLLMGTFPSNVGLAVADLARQRKVLFLAAEPLTDKIVWENGNRYTFRLRASTYMQTAMLAPEAAKLGKKRWAIVYPNYEYGQSATQAFKKQMMALQSGGIEFIEQAVPLGKIDAGPVVQALADA
jgi:branched-chain amino acid transport system substrate-binding protein